MENTIKKSWAKLFLVLLLINNFLTMSECSAINFDEILHQRYNIDIIINRNRVKDMFEHAFYSYMDVFIHIYTIFSMLIPSMN